MDDAARGTATSTNTGSLTASATAYIGKNTNNITYTGSIGELVGFNTAQTTTDQRTIAEYLGPSRLILHIPEADNVVQDWAGGRTPIKESATLATMRGSPFQVTILRASKSQSSSYTESKATQP